MATYLRTRECGSEAFTPAKTVDIVVALFYTLKVHDRVPCGE